MARKRTKSPPPESPLGSTMGSGAASPSDLRLARLRQWRNRPQRDVRLGDFLPAWVERNITQPRKGLGKITALWLELAPPEVLAHTRLESLRGGVLRVGVDSSAWRYEIDRLLREGLRDRLIKALTGVTLMRIDLKVVDARDWTRAPESSSDDRRGKSERGGVIDEVLGDGDEE